MEKKYKIIRTIEQYDIYCNELRRLVFEDETNIDDIELLTLLIKKWDSDNLPQVQSDPIELVKALMQQNRMKVKDLAEVMQVNKSTVSRILNYQKGLSKNTIRVLSEYFSISQEALNKPYKLRQKLNGSSKHKSLRNTKSQLEEV